MRNILQTKTLNYSLNKYKKKVCCVIIEPIQGCLPTTSGINYLKFLNNYCKKNNLILIFDEIITGIRVNCSSIQNELKIKSDISTFGKVLNNPRWKARPKRRQPFRSNPLAGTRKHERLCAAFDANLVALNVLSRRGPADASIVRNRISNYAWWF